MDPILNALTKELIEKDRCHTVVQDGSRARGLTTPTSEHDVLNLRRRGGKFRIAKKQSCFYGMFLFTKKKISESWATIVSTGKTLNLFIQKVIMAPSCFEGWIKFQKNRSSNIQKAKLRGALAIIDVATGKTIGSSRFYNFDPNHLQIKIGFTFLTQKFWGGTYNCELKALMLNHVFPFVGEVRFEIGEQNIRSRKAIEKLGAQLSCTEILDEVRYVIYQISKDRFLELYK